MSRLVPVVLLAAVSTIVRGEPPAEAVALQRAVYKVIDTAEPSIACVLISRSEMYGKLGEGPTAADAGKLGEFTPHRHEKFADNARRELIKRLDLAQPENVPESYGSGVVIDDSGLVLTTYSVIERAQKVFVRLPGTARGSYADILAADSRADLAILKLIRPPTDLKAVPFGDGGKVRKGDWVIALANPFAAGFKNGSPSASWGIIANTRRQTQGPTDEVKRAKPLSQYGTLLQTDARLNIGCSGGALLDMEGRLVGLTTNQGAVTGQEGSGGYAIPIDTNVKKMIEILKRGEEIEYGFLGVTVNTTERGDGRGVVISDVAAGQPAARGGLLRGDKVIAINGNPVREYDDLFMNIAAALAGSEVEVEVVRGPAKRKLTARLAKSGHSEPRIASNRPKPVFGLSVDYTSTLSIDTNPLEGVLIRKELEPGSPAEKKFKEWLDRSELIIVKVNDKHVSTPSDFYREAAGKDSIVLDVFEAVRDNDPRHQRIKLP